MKRFVQSSLLLVVFAFSAITGFTQDPPTPPAQSPPQGGLAPTARGGRGARGGGPPSMLQISTNPGPAAEMVQAALDAFNRRDLNYFRTALADDAVWLDDDGHIFASKAQIITIPLTAELTEATKRKLTPSNMRSIISGDTAWATFYYELDTDGILRHGLSTMVFRKIGNDWRIAVVQAASNMMQQHLQGDKTEQ